MDSSVSSVLEMMSDNDHKTTACTAGNIDEGDGMLTPEGGQMQQERRTCGRSPDKNGGMQAELFSFHFIAPAVLIHEFIRGQIIFGHGRVIPA